MTNYDILNNFDKIDINNLSKESALLYRIELKYIIKEEDINSLLNILFHNNFKVITINSNIIQQYKNTYFDSKNLDLFKTWDGGVKVRIREYESGESFFELKEKINGISKKNRTKIDIYPKEYKYKNIILNTILQNSYSRYSFIHNNKNIRITLDTEITYKYFSNNLEKVFPGIIIEIKGEKNDIEDIKQIFIHFNRVKFSKYKHGIRILKENQTL